MHINYKGNLSQLREQQFSFLDSNIREIDELLSDGKVAQAYSKLRLEAHTDYMKTFAITLLGREVSEALETTRYKILIDDNYINFVSDKYAIKIPLTNNDLNIVLVINHKEWAEITRRARDAFSQFIDEGWNIDVVKTLVSK